MTWLTSLVMALLRWLHELAQLDVSGQDAKKDDELKNKLLDRIDAHERELRVESDLRAARAAGETGGADKGPSVGS